MSTKAINQNQLVYQPLFNSLVPDEGPKGIPFTLDFTSATTQTLDYQNMQQRGFVSEIQSMWIDTKDAGGACEITISVSNQRVTIPAGRQGYLSIMVPNPPRFSFTCASGQVRISLLNFPVSNVIYATA